MGIAAEHLNLEVYKIKTRTRGHNAEGFSFALLGRKERATRGPARNNCRSILGLVRKKIRCAYDRLRNELLRHYLINQFYIIL